MHKYIVLILVFILIGCTSASDDVVYAPPEEAEIVHHGVPGSVDGILEVCSDDLTFTVSYSYRNPNENIDKIHIRISGEQSKILGDDEESLNCPDCDMTSLVLQAYDHWLNRTLIIDAWLIDLKGASSVVYTFEIYIKGGECNAK